MVEHRRAAETRSAPDAVVVGVVVVVVGVVVVVVSKKMKYLFVPITKKDKLALCLPPA